MVFFTILFAANVLVTVVGLTDNLLTNVSLNQILMGQQENTKLIQKLLADNEILHRHEEMLSEESRNLKNELNHLKKLLGKSVFSQHFHLHKLRNVFRSQKLRSYIYTFSERHRVLCSSPGRRIPSYRRKHNTIRPGCYKLRKRLQHSIGVIYSSTTWILCLHHVFPRCNWSRL